jgi:hypothetical protein
MTTFEEQFPSLAGLNHKQTVWADWMVLIPQDEVEKSCLDKRRVREVIAKLRYTPLAEDPLHSLHYDAETLEALEKALGL